VCIRGLHAHDVIALTKSTRAVRLAPIPSGAISNCSTGRFNRLTQKVGYPKFFPPTASHPPKAVGVNSPRALASLALRGEPGVQPEKRARNLKIAVAGMVLIGAPEVLIHGELQRIFGKVKGLVRTSWNLMAGSGRLQSLAAELEARSSNT
jgi:hypothetical protein